MPSCDLTSPMATVWVNLMRMVTPKNSPIIASDNAIIAKVQLQETITHLRAIEKSLREELQVSATHVRTAQQAQAKTTLQHLLVRARAKRIRLAQTVNKRANMEQQLDALCMSELNNQVISSMQKTNLALKSLGVREAIENADEVMLDMQETQQDLGAMQDALGQSLSFDSLDDDDLAKELEILLQGDENALLEIPFTRNQMSAKTEAKTANTEPTPRAETVAEESGTPDMAAPLAA